MIFHSQIIEKKETLQYHFLTDHERCNRQEVSRMQSKCTKNNIAMVKVQKKYAVIGTAVQVLAGKNQSKSIYLRKAFKNERHVLFDKNVQTRVLYRKERTSLTNGFPTIFPLSPTPLPSFPRLRLQDIITTIRRSSNGLYIRQLDNTP